jgi:arylsulfatase A-like enzyme/uncharacterized membrane protein YbhN (UPF0104 family)
MRILLEIVVVALLALVAARTAPPPWRGRLLNLFKAYVTVRAFWLLLAHEVAMAPDQIAELNLAGVVPEGAQHVPAWRLILAQLQRIDASTFWTFVALAAGVKFVGILASMSRWLLLLMGQGVELPFRHVFGSFLIGRFIGTFLPSTAGLDGYKLYDAARFSGRTVEATAATVVEKVIGISGIFLSFLVALPFGIRIFGERGPLVAALTVPVALGLIGALLVALWFPGLIQWLLGHLPLPGKARLEGLVMRISRSAAAYRDRKLLVLVALFLSFVVHFTTAAMYYFTALAISARGAEFWPIAFGSSIQIFATVISPFTIAGEGIREAAQYVLLGNMIGPAAAIVSAALGFWAAEALTLAGGIFWWLRGPDYRPAYCRVNGDQVDYETAARAALVLETDEDRARRAARPASPVEPLARRLRASVGLGVGAGLVGGLVIGLVEAVVILRGGASGEAQVLWYGPFVHALLLGAAGGFGGAVLGFLPMEPREVRGWPPSLTLLAVCLPFALLVTLFRVRRDFFHEQMPPVPVLAAILGVAGVLALALFLLGPRLLAGRAGAPFRPRGALALVALVGLGGAIGARVVAPARQAPAAAPPVPAALAAQPNLLLIMVDTLRADVLSCYGGPVEAPALCGLAGGTGSRFQAFSHASWTKPAAATLLTSLLPSSHGAMSKTAVLPGEVELVSEVLERRGYVTGGIVSNINLTPSFGFDQGWDEYHYLGPDYLAGAKESSSKLIAYQILRKVWFKLRPGHRVSDFYQDAATVNRVAFDWLERHRASRFFLFLHYMDPHDPYFAHPYDGTAVARVEREHPDPSQADLMRRLYHGEIRWLDAHLADLFQRLRALGLYEDLLIVLTSDHGEEFHEHGGWWHGKTLYDEQIQVPLLVKWPRGAATTPSGDGRLVRLIDVAPTLAARAGAEVPPAMQGGDLANGPREPVLFAEEDHEGNVLRAVRTGRWKLIEANPGNPRGLPPVELFAIDRDPRETRNLGASHAERVTELRAEADAQERFAESRAVATGETAVLTREECEKLRVLGYVQDCEGVN